MSISNREMNAAKAVTLAIQPEMYDNSLNFEPTFIDTGVLYFSVKCQASDCSGRQEAGCGHPPSYARSQKREPAFWVLLRIKSSRNAAFYLCVMATRKMEIALVQMDI